MDGDRSDRDPFVGLPLLPAPRMRRRVSTHRIGPLRTVAEAAGHPVLNGIRSGAITGLVIAAALGLPVLLILGAKTPGSPVPVRPSAESVDGSARTQSSIALAEPVRVEPAVTRAASPRAPVDADRVVLDLRSLPVLDDESGALSVEEPPAAKPGRPSRIALPRPSRTP